MTNVSDEGLTALFMAEAFSPTCGADGLSARWFCEASRLSGVCRVSDWNPRRRGEPGGRFSGEEETLSGTAGGLLEVVLLRDRRKVKSSWVAPKVISLAKASNPSSFASRRYLPGGEFSKV